MSNPVGKCSEGTAYVPYSTKFGEKRFDGMCFDVSEVTNAAFGPTKIEKRFIESGFDAPGQPVVYVTWDEASNYCLMRGGRLPAQDEWQFAAADKSCGAAESIYLNCAPQADGCLDKKKSCAVKSFKANQYGLFDMVGNVREWMIGRRIYFDPSPIVCGESWYGKDDGVRILSKICDCWSKENSHEQLGFRCVYPPKDL